MPKLFIILAAISWGFIGFFVKGLSAFGYSEMEIVAIRVGMAAFLLLIYLAISGKGRELKVKPRHLPLFIGTGLFSIVFFNWCYFAAMNRMSISLAVMLLYTSPAFVAVLSAAVLREKLTARKLAAIAATIGGCAMIALSGKSGGGDWSGAGFLLGLGAGLGYALYSIFGKLALRHYSPAATTFYTFLVAAVSLVPFFPFWKKAGSLLGEAWLYMFGLGLIPTVLAFLLYTGGLEKVESSQAAILATVEPVAAVFLGVLLYREQLTAVELIGAAFILSSIFITSGLIRKNKPSSAAGIAPDKSGP